MIYRTTITITTILLMFSACTNKNVRQEVNEAPMEIEQTTNQMTYETNNDIANHLATIAQEVPDVLQAVAIVAGPYAVVGINIDDTTERQRVGTIKYSVSEALRNDPYGKTAVVIADADMMERLRQMRKRMNDGEPIAGVIDELSAVVARYMPIFPVPEHDGDMDDYDQEQPFIDEPSNHEQNRDNPTEHDETS